MKPFVSIIVPVYKVELYLKECIESILKQTYSHFELILVDDGSPDKCGCICDKYSKMDSRVLVIHKKNGGLSEARNEGLKIARGEYVTLIDSDDYVSEVYLEKLVMEAENKNVDIVVGMHCRVDENKNISYDVKPTDSMQLSNFQALENIFYQKNITIAAWGKLYKRKLFNNISYPIGVLYEDILTTPKLFLESINVSYIRDIIYFYRIRNDSITQSQFNKKTLDSICNSEKILNYLPQGNKQLIKSAKSYCFGKYCNVFLQINESYDEENFDLWNKIKINRAKELLNRKSRIKNKLAALCSYSGYKCFRKIYYTFFEVGKTNEYGNKKK